MNRLEMIVDKINGLMSLYTQIWGTFLSPILFLI